MTSVHHNPASAMPSVSSQYFIYNFLDASTVFAQTKANAMAVKIMLRKIYIVFILMNTRRAKAPLVGLNKLKLFKMGQCKLHLNLLKIKLNICSRELKKL